jgi:BirA family transcriptional regulator, biotin operon repressor / biotin---[acetyl-CoA-carboxylase] ligase
VIPEERERPPDGGLHGEPLTHWEGEPVRVWESVWQLPRFEAWSRLGSTNDRLRALALEGAGPFTVVVAEEQTTGRGRAGRRWESPPGLGLWMSVLLRPAAAEAARLAPLIVGLAVCRAFERTAGELSATLKWPNDVLLGERKAAGVLCESVGGRGVVAGVGINVRQRLSDFPEPLRGRAVSLEMAAGHPVSRAALAGALVQEMRTLLSRPPLRLEGGVAEELARRDALYGREVRVEGGVEGIARGVDTQGRLQVEVAPGRCDAVVAGSVTILSGRGTLGPSPRS